MDDIKINRLTIKYSIITVVILIILISLMIIIRKDRYYANRIQFIDNKKAYILVDKNVFEEVKSNNKIILNDISYDFSIEKIEEQEVMIANITFNQELVVNTNIYKIQLEDENLISYITRIIKGEKK